MVVAATEFLTEVFYHPYVLADEPLLKAASLEFLRAVDAAIAVTRTASGTFILPALARHPAVLTSLMANFAEFIASSDQNHWKVFLEGGWKVSSFSFSVIGQLAEYLAPKRLLSVLDDANYLRILAMPFWPRQMLQEQCVWVYAGLGRLDSSSADRGTVFSKMLTALTRPATVSGSFLAAPSCIDILVHFGEEQHALPIAKLLKVCNLYIYFSILIVYFSVVIYNCVQFSMRLRVLRLIALWWLWYPSCLTLTCASP